ncbi:hypothetical protein ACHAWT_008170 [Skeletonema menzelii]
MAMSLFNSPSIRRVLNCSETFAIMDNCNSTIVGGPPTQRTVLSSQSSLSSSNSIKDDDNVDLIKVLESIKEKKIVVPIEVDESEGNEIYNLLVKRQHEPEPHTPDKETDAIRKISFPEDSVDNVANFIDVRKLVGRKETNYYYSESNLSARKRVEKLKIRKQKRRGTLASLDESAHSRMSYLSFCTRMSAYKGPTPLKKDGSSIQSILKKRNVLGPTFSTDDTVDCSHDTVDCSRTGEVDFSHIDIREFERIPGDNPCVRAGVPLSIGWAHIQHDPISLDDYENAKGPPRDKIEMMVPAGVRKSMLRDEFKVSIADLNAAMKSVNICKRQRAHTLKTERLEVLEEFRQSAKRKFKRAVGKAVSSSQQAEELWENSYEAVRNDYLEKALEGELIDLELDVTPGVNAIDSLHSVESAS